MLRITQKMLIKIKKISARISLGVFAIPDLRCSSAGTVIAIGAHNTEPNKDMNISSFSDNSMAIYEAMRTTQSLETLVK